MPAFSKYSRVTLNTIGASSIVRELEHELEVRLPERGAVGVTLTTAGERFHALAGPLVDAMERLFDDFAGGVEGEVRGRVDVAASVAGAAIVLPPYVKRLRERHPGVRLRVRSGALGEGLGRLRAGEVECVLGAREPLDDAGLEYREMLRYDTVLVTSRDHALAGRETVTPREMAEWPAIVPPAGSNSRRFGERAARELGVDVNAVVEVGGWGVIKRYVERGIGICVVPSICLHETDRLAVIALARYFEPRSFGVYTRRGRALTPPARASLRPGSGARRRRARTGATASPSASTAGGSDWCASSRWMFAAMSASPRTSALDGDAKGVRRRRLLLFSVLAAALLAVLALWLGAGGGGRGAPEAPRIAAELAGPGTAEEAWTRRSETRLGSIEAKLRDVEGQARRLQSENERLRGRLADDAALENTPRGTPKRIAAATAAPAHPPVAAAGVNACVKMRPMAAGTSAMLTIRRGVRRCVPATLARRRRRSSGWLRRSCARSGARPTTVRTPSATRQG